ncbi:MAG: hypothetical protein ACK4JY_12325 [Brevundimonas sp.]|uniref:hypothetical protein n=1 Tax=Brevundimonas sp. TaxID=1871086 RepID=UPI00391939F4
MLAIVHRRSRSLLAPRGLDRAGKVSARLLCGSALGCSLIVLAAPGMARADDECGPNNGAPVTCTASNYPNGVAYTNIGQPLDLILSPQTHIGTGADGRHGLHVTGNLPAISIVSDGSITTTGLTAAGLRVDGGAGAVMIGSNLIDTSGDGSAGLFVRTGSGAVTVDSASIITRGGPSADGNDYAEGLAVFTDTGAIDITSGAVTVGGLYVSGIVGVTRDADVTVTSGLITSTSDGSSSMYVEAGEGGDISITSGTIISRNQGVAAQGTESISVASDEILISDSGDTGHHGLLIQSTGGPVVIDSGVVATAGPRGFGIIGYGDTVSIVSETVTTTGAGSIGVRASAAAGVEILSGSVTTTGDVLDVGGTLYFSRGIDASSGGDINIVSGAISTAGDGAEGIWTFSQTGAITIDSGSIVTGGNDAHGILIDPDGDVHWTDHRGADPANGTGVLSIVSGTIETSGLGARGVFVDHVGPISIDSESVHTTGEMGWGIYVYGGDGVTIDSDSVIVEGDIAPGIVVRTDAGDIAIASRYAQANDDVGVAGISNSGDISIVSETVLTTLSGPIVRTDSFTPDGIYAASGSGAVSIDSGSVEVRADDAWGVVGLSGSGLVSVTSDQIVTAGERGYGLFARGGSGVAVDSGSIATVGVEGVGIRAFSNGAGDVAIVSDSIATEGDEADGIWAFSQTGAISIASGSIVTAGDEAAGIFVDRDADSSFTGLRGAQADNGLGALDIVSGSIVTAGEGSVGIHVDHLGAISIASESIETSGLAGAGLLAYGGAPIAIDSGSVVTLGDMAPGVTAYSDTGVVDISSALIETAGAGAYGLGAFGRDRVSIVSDSITTTGGGAGVGGRTYLAHGVWAESQLGDIAIDSGSIAVAGDGSIGINAMAVDGSIAIISDSVTATGDLLVSQAIGSGGETVNVNNFANGVYARSLGGGDVSVDSGAISVAGRQAWGLYARAFGGTTTVISDSIVTSGDGGRGIYAVGLGDVSVTSDSIVTTGGYGVSSAAEGVYAWSQQGALTVDAGSISTEGVNASGIWAQTGPGAVTISVDEIATEGLRATGVRTVTGGGGGATVDAGSVTTRGDYADGVFVSSGDGDATVTVASVEAFGGGSAGVRVVSNAGDVVIAVAEATTHGDTLFVDEADPGTFAEAVTAYTNSGDIAITAGHTTVSGLYASGVSAVSESGSVSITSQLVDSTAEGAAALAAYANFGGTINILSGDINATSTGVQAIGVSDIAITSDTISTTGGNGVYAQTTDGSIAVDSGAITTAGVGGRGMRLDAGGTIDVISSSITTSGGAGATASGVVLYSHGVHAVAAGDITIDSGSITTSGDGSAGMMLTSNGGDISVMSDSIAVTGAGATGVWATSAGSVDIFTGDILASGVDGVGVRVNAQELTLNVTGDVVAAQGYGAHVTLSGSGEINLASGASLQGGVAGLYLSSLESSTINILGEIVGLGGGAALVVEGAPVTINNNSNTIVGSITLTDGADTFNNNGTWRAAGVSDFGAGDDAIVNNGLFSATDGGDVVIGGLESFQNNARIDLRNGQLGDSLDLGGAAYVGGAGSSLLVDVDFATGESDSLAVGSATGSTGIVVNNVATQPGFSSGLSFIQSDTPLTGSEFALDPAAIEDGFIDYDLEFDAATNSYIVKALPSGDSVSMLRAGAAAHDYAAKSGEAWSGRMEDFRDSQWAGIGRAGRNEAWGQMLVGERELEQVGTFDLLGVPTVRDISSNASWRGFQMGMDHAYGSARGSAIVGVTAGVMDYEMKFTADRNSFDLTGFNIGAYAAWTFDGLVVSGLAKYDQFDVDANLFELDARGELEGSTVGLRGEAAYRFGDAILFMEPVAGVEWMEVDLDRLSAAGATADFDKATSLRGKIGLRAGGRTRSGDWTMAPSIGVFAIEEFEGENGMRFALGATDYRVRDQPYETHGRADLGLSIDGPGGLQAYSKAEIDFGDGAEGVTWRLGARWSW